MNKFVVNMQTGSQQLVEMSAEEIAQREQEYAAIPDERYWESLRAQRNQLLAATDYFANSDVTMSDEMRTYRQALRDLPANTADPANPSWPTKPGG